MSTASSSSSHEVASFSKHEEAATKGTEYEEDEERGSAVRGSYFIVKNLWRIMVERHKIFYIFSCVHFDSKESLRFHSSSTTAHTSTALIDFIIIPRLGVYGRLPEAACNSRWQRTVVRHSHPYGVLGIVCCGQIDG